MKNNNNTAILFGIFTVTVPILAIYASRWIELRNEGEIAAFVIATIGAVILGTIGTIHNYTNNE
jgi:uncharacterized membrane protein YvlD (DUF360 family)